MRRVPNLAKTPFLLEVAVMNACSSLPARWSLFLLALLLGLPAAAGAAPRRASKPPAKPAPGPKPSALSPQPSALPIAQLALEPSTATLAGPRAEQHFLVTATLRDGSTLDVTGRAAFRVDAPKVARVSAAGVAAPLSDGETKVVATVGAATTPEATLTVQDAGAPATLSFVNDVMPVLSKQGCNASVCHGSPAGKGGFKLSLFGYEPDLDQVALRDKEGRRINLKTPEKSLLLQKPTAAVAHGGGLRFRKGSAEYNTLLAWIKAGAPGMGELEARVRGIAAIPAERWLPKAGETQRLVVMATLSDGTRADVTDQALYSANDDSIADVSPAGVVTAKAPGETAIMVRHLGQVGVTRVAVLPSWKIDPWPALPASNFIDTLVFEKLRQLRTLPSDLSSDEEFARRAYLDTTGMVPTPDETRTFLANRYPQKRAQLIDSLLARPEFVDLWTLKWNDTLRNNPRLTRLGVSAYYNWIRDQVANNVPFDQFVRGLLTATGRNTTAAMDASSLPPQLQNRPGVQQLLQRIQELPPNGATNYFLVSRDPLDLTSATSQVFLGVRIECARCHNHPFEKWTQNDYYGLATFFAEIRRVGNGNQTPAAILASLPDGPARRGRKFGGGGVQIRNPKTNQPVEPKFLDETEVKIEDDADPRAALADWITSPNNPFFARATANRVWAHFMGRGIVDPIDNFRATNPPSNPALLDALAKELVDHHYDLKHLMRVIMNSRVYQLSSRANAYNKQDTRNFARFYPKRLTAEQLYDSISQATASFTPFGAERRGGGGMGGNLQAQLLREAMPPDATRAHQIPVPRVPGELGSFLDTFGRPRREVVCECERSADGSVTQALTLINSDLINRKIAYPNGRVRRLADSRAPDLRVVQECYLATLSRYPTPDELRDAEDLLRSTSSRRESLEDLMWSLLNTREFLFNH